MQNNRKNKFQNIFVFLTVAVALCAVATVFVSGEVDGASCETEGIWSVGTRASAAWDGTIDTNWYNASNTTFTITTANDIDLNNKPWTPIGTYVDGTGTNDKPFSGVFDGGGYNINNLYINLPATRCYRLFGYNVGGVIKNVNVVGGSFAGAANDIGGVVGINSGTVSNCSNTGNITGTGDFVAGVVGENDSGIVVNCSNMGSITGVGYYVGGVVGGSNSSVTNCSNMGDISETSGTGAVGGVVGVNSLGTVSNCSNTGKVSGTYVGGVVGENNTSTVSNCEWVSFDILGTASKDVSYSHGASSVVGNKKISHDALENLSIVGILVRPTQFKIDGNTVQLTPLVHPATVSDTKKSVTWTSNNTNIATVSNGLVAGVAKGSTTIQVATQTTVLGGGKGTTEATCEVFAPTLDPIKKMNDKLEQSGVQLAILNAEEFPSADARVETTAPTMSCYDPSGKPAGVVDVDITNTTRYPNPDTLFLHMEYSLTLNEEEIHAMNAHVGRRIDVEKLFATDGVPNTEMLNQFFGVFVIQKEIMQGARKGQLARLLGGAGEQIITPQRAIDEKILTMNVFSAEKKVHFTFTYFVKDGADAPKLNETGLMIGDGFADRRIIDPLWTSTRKSTGATPDGGSGCNAVATLPAAGFSALLLVAAIPILRRRR